MISLPHVILMRGLPGSGKSTAAKRIARLLTQGRVGLYEIVSNDTYQERWPETVRHGPVYDFQEEFAPLAHAACFRQYLRALDDSTPLIIVDNTNTFPILVAPYMLAAAAYQRQATICEVPCDVETAKARNIHNVPAATIERMHKGMESGLPGHWKLIPVSELLPHG
jgi:tRNA uridine 5-carbamoylmethylation protein Kti12